MNNSVNEINQISPFQRIQTLRYGDIIYLNVDIPS